MKFLLVDDHALFREGMASILNSFADEVTVLQARGIDDAMQLLAEHRDLSLMLLDLNLEGEDGISILEAATAKYPTIPIAVLSASTNQQDVDKVMNASAVGFIPKATSAEVLFSALRIILAGDLYVPASARFKANTAVGTSNDLTERQTEVLSLIAQGKSNKLIAADLNISLATVKMHVTAIFKQLGVTNRTQAVLKVQGS